MIGTIRKHSQFLWVFIIAGTIIAFVVFFMPGQDPLDFGSSVDYGTRYGVKLNLEDHRAAQRDANLLFLSQVGRLPDNNSRVNELIEERLMLNALAKKEGITVSDETMRAWIRQIFRDRQTGKPSAQLYDGFIQRVQQSTRYTEIDVEDWVRNTAAIDHLRRLYTLSGSLIGTRAADLFIRRENEQAEAEFVFVSLTNYLSQVKYTTNDIATYFTNNTANFRIPERVVVNYVHFDFSDSNYLAEAAKVVDAKTNLQSLIDAEYVERGTNSFRTFTNVITKITNTITQGTNSIPSIKTVTNRTSRVMTKAEAAKEIREDLIDEEAGKVGEEAARQFANEVFKIAEVKTENLLNVAKQMGYEVKETKPFTQFDGPEEFDAPGSFASVAFGLSPEEPLASPIKGVDGVFVIGFNRRVASEIPELTNVWDKVVEDYRDFTANDLLRENGQKIAEAIDKGLASGKLLDDVLKAQNLDAVSIPPFSRTTRSIPQVETFGVTTEEFINAAFELKEGSASDFRRAREGGYVVILKKRMPISDERVASGLENYVKDLRESRMGLVNRAWIQEEYIRSGVAAERQAEQRAREQEEAEAQARAQAKENQAN